MASDGLRSVGGLQVASGWLMKTPLGLFVLASGWLARSQWVADVDSIGFICYSQWVAYVDSIGFICYSRGWLTQILLVLFVLCYSQWVAYVDFVGFICYSQWVVCTDPLTLCVLASGWLEQFHLVSFIFISFTCSASGWPGCSQWVVYAVSFVILIFPVLDRSVWAALGLKRAAPKVCVLSYWDKLRFRGE